MFKISDNALCRDVALHPNAPDIPPPKDRIKRMRERANAGAARPTKIAADSPSRKKNNADER